MVKNKAVGTYKWIGIVAGVILGCMVTIWICSHRSHPMINDWEMLGNNINTVEQKYGDFKQYITRDDGSGYAVLMTEQITGKSVYDAGDYSCYYMEFDQTGKIVKVYCARPAGG